MTDIGGNWDMGGRTTGWQDCGQFRWVGGLFSDFYGWRDGGRAEMRMGAFAEVEVCQIGTVRQVVAALPKEKWRLQGA